MDYILTRWPGYTLRDIDAEDAYRLLQTIALLQDDVGEERG